MVPQGPCIAPAGAQQFTANLTNISNSGVDWSVDNIKGGNSSVGTITSDGLYGAPSSPGQHTVGAVSQADTKASSSTSVIVTNAPQFGVAPDSATIPVSAQQSFQGQICGLPDTNVTWAVDDQPGGNATVGTIIADGVYTAPESSGTHTVKATDFAQNTSSSAVVKVSSGITVDFGSRTTTQHPVPAGVLAVNHVDFWYPQVDEAKVAQAGFTLSRSFAYLPVVYATKTPNWTAIDPQISKLQASGLHVMLQIMYTPPWLQGSLTGCGTDKTKGAPSDPNAWAQLAKAFVAHMDTKFPGVVTQYEIWNEPDTGGLCGTTNRLATYQAIYAAAAPLIKQQAASDGFTVKVGGPAISSMNSTWFQTLLTNSSTGPYIDFLSYHQYLTGKSNINATWDTNNGTTPLYSLTQNGTTGAAATYAAGVKAAVAAKPSHTPPVFIDEYNTNWAFLADCCRNDPTYSPVFNTLYVSDVMDTVYSGTAQVPGQLDYYAAVSEPYFCLLGDWNTAMDCSHSSATPLPYPQYYAYELMASPQYLGMNAGGYMAASVSPLPSASGVAVSAFYTSKQDSILIVNPTSTTYSDILSVRNPGYSSPTATLYQIVKGQSISQLSLSLKSSGGAYTATISIPPYSVFGIAIK